MARTKILPLVGTGKGTVISNDGAQNNLLRVYSWDGSGPTVGHLVVFIYEADLTVIPGALYEIEDFVSSNTYGNPQVTLADPLVAATCNVSIGGIITITEKGDYTIPKNTIVLCKSSKTIQCGEIKYDKGSASALQSGVNCAIIPGKNWVDFVGFTEINPGSGFSPIGSDA